MRCQVVGGFQSMKKQGPAPCGMKQVGMRVAADMRDLSKARTV